MAGNFYFGNCNLIAVPVTEGAKLLGKLTVA